MTYEAQRIEIAEAFGFSDLKFAHAYGRETEPIRLSGIHPSNTVSRTLVPDYLNDLNAMHEAEKVLTAGQLETFRENLSDLLGDSCRMGFAIHATAAQRAEAFLRTIEKWEESAL